MVARKPRAMLERRVAGFLKMLSSINYLRPA
jgi:hypothetical protein